MAASDNIIGSVGVVIVGDSSRLAGDFAKAQQIAKAAGAQISAALTQALTPAFTNASGLVDQFGRKLQSVGVASQAATVPVVNLARAGDQLASSLLRLAGAEDVAAASAKTLGSAHGGAVSELQATSGALRVLEGSGGIRAAEKFLTLIPGLGAALQFAFPIVGAIALGSAMARIADESIDLKGKLEALKEAAKATDAEFANLTKSIDSINVARQTRDFGGASGLRLKANLGAQDAQSEFERAKSLRESAARLKTEFDLNNAVNPAVLVPKFGNDIIRAQQAQLDKLEQEAEGAAAKSRALGEQVNKDREDAGKAALAESSAIELARIQNLVRANSQQAELAKQRIDIWIGSERALALASINEQLDAHSRAVAAAALDVQLAEERAAKLGAISYAETQKEIQLVRQRAAAESAGKTPGEVAKIQTTASGEVAGLNSRQEQRELELHKGVLEASEKYDLARVDQDRFVTEEIIREGDKRLAAINREVDAVVAADLRLNAERARVQGIAERAQGSQAGRGIESQKLVLERAYGLEVSHTLREQLKYQSDLNDLDEQERKYKILGLDAASATALKAGDLVRWAELAAEANGLAAENANKTYQAKTKELEAARQLSLVYQIQSRLGSGGAAGDQIKNLGATAVSEGVHGIATGLAQAVLSGQRLSQVLGNLGKNLAISTLGSVLEIGLKKALVALLGLVPAFAAVGTAQVSAAASAKVATSALNVAAVTSAAAVGAANAAAATALIPIIGPELAPGVAAATFAEIIAWAPLAAFADGGRPPVGIASIVGERGPELFVPDGAGTIIPAGQFGAGGINLPQGFAAASSSSSQSIGEFHFHAHGINDAKAMVREIARALPGYLKSTSPKFSPNSR